MGVYIHMDCQSTWSVETLHNIHIDTDMDRRIDHLKSPCLHIISHMECGDIIAQLQQ